jgi:hypothetical protein
MEHLTSILQLLHKHCLCAKLSKYFAFASTQIEYLGHIISQDRVATDPEKISVMLN